MITQHRRETRSLFARTVREVHRHRDFFFFIDLAISDRPRERSRSHRSIPSFICSSREKYQAIRFENRFHLIVQRPLLYVAAFSRRVTFSMPRSHYY